MNARWYDTGAGPYMAATVAGFARDSIAANFDGSAITLRDWSRVLPSDHGVSGARKLSETRRGGRCTRVVYQYADGSQLRFTWSEAEGSRIVTRRDESKMFSFVAD